MAYKKRTKSTKRKSYKDYLDYRAEQIAKGYTLKDLMSEAAFNEYYDILQEAKRSGEIKSGAWQTLKRMERYEASEKRIRVLQKAIENRSGVALSRSKILKLPKSELESLYAYINMTKHTGIYGGDYE